MLLTRQETQLGSLQGMNHNAGLSLEAWKSFLGEKSLNDGLRLAVCLGSGGTGVGATGTLLLPQEDVRPDSPSLLPEQHHAAAHFCASRRRT